MCVIVASAIGVRRNIMLLLVANGVDCNTGVEQFRSNHIVKDRNQAASAMA